MNNIILKNLKLLSIFAAIFFTGVFVKAQAEVPSDKIRLAIEEVRTIVVNESDKVPDPQIDEKLKKIIRPLFDFEEMSKRSLGANWSKANQAEQKEFVELFSELLARTYLKRIKRNAKSSKIDKLVDSIEGDKALVKSSVLVDEEEVSIDYRLYLSSGQWKIYDVVIENVGLVSNYRNEFAAIVRKDGFSGLIDGLKKKQSNQ